MALPWKKKVYNRDCSGYIPHLDVGNYTIEGLAQSEVNITKKNNIEKYQKHS